MDAGIDDPRPVFEGDWKTASAQERGRHGAAVQRWQRRQPKPPEPESKPIEGHEPHAADIATLDSVIRNAKHDADRIRAVDTKQRILARREAAAREEEHGDLVALHSTLLALPVEERVDALCRVLAVAAPAPLHPADHADPAPPHPHAHAQAGEEVDEL
jgi:hypothetical protein